MKLSSSSPLFSIFSDYKTWLHRQPLSVYTQRAYCTQVQQFCIYLDQTDREYGVPLKDKHARDYAVRDYKAYLKTDRKRKPPTVNKALTRIDNFYRFLQLPPADAKREDLPQHAPHALTEDEK